MADTAAAGSWVKVTVSRERCQGHARCNDICPGVFGLDDEGYVEVLQELVEGELAEAAKKAVLNCPEYAISLEPYLDS